MDESWIIAVLREPLTPAYVALLVFAGLVMRNGSAWMAALTERFRAKATIAAEDAERLREEIKERTEENSLLREKLNECESGRISWMHRAVTAEATLLGQGEAKQSAQRKLSADRLADKAKREGGS